MVWAASRRLESGGGNPRPLMLPVRSLWQQRCTSHPSPLPFALSNGSVCGPYAVAHVTEIHDPYWSENEER